MGMGRQTPDFRDGRKGRPCILRVIWNGQQNLGKADMGEIEDVNLYADLLTLVVTQWKTR